MSSVTGTSRYTTRHSRSDGESDLRASLRQRPRHCPSSSPRFSTRPPSPVPALQRFSPDAPRWLGLGTRPLCLRGSLPPAQRRRWRRRHEIAISASSARSKSRLRQRDRNLGFVTVPRHNSRQRSAPSITRERRRLYLCSHTSPRQAECEAHASHSLSQKPSSPLSRNERRRSLPSACWCWRGPGPDKSSCGRCGRPRRRAAMHCLASCAG